MKDFEENEFEQLVSNINNCGSSRKAEFYFFEYFLKNELLESQYDDISELIVKNGYYKFIKILLKESDYKIYYDKEDDNLSPEVLSVMKEAYDKILEKFNYLVSELKLKNSLEISHLFTYMLYKGYFSSSLYHEYKLDDRKDILGHYAYSIFEGRGVCLNYSDMLADILTTKGYSSAILLNNSKGLKVKGVKTNFKRNIIKSRLSTRIHLFLVKLSRLSMLDHACNLVIDNDKPYIYDSTNITMLECIDNKRANNLLGTGYIQINPYLSASFSKNNESFKLIKDFSLRDNYGSPYTKKDFLETLEDVSQKCQDDVSLLDDFHRDILDDVNLIVEKAKVLKK